MIGLASVVLSNVAYWHEDGLHVFRSTEYDVIAADEDKQAAIIAFVEQSEDYASFLAESAEPTVDDLTISAMILRRLLDSYDSFEAHRGRRLAAVRKLRGRGHSRARGWHHEPAALT